MTDAIEPTSAELLAALVDRHGMSLRGIGARIDRDSSLLSAVRRGAKPGANLRGPLADVLGQLEAGAPRQAVTTAPPERRRRASGDYAHVRRAATFRGGSGRWTVTKLGRQAARGTGGQRLAPVVHDAAEAGRRVAADLSFGRGAVVHGTSGGRRKGGHLVSMEFDADELLERADELGGDVLAAMLEQAEARGYVTAPGGKSDVTGVQVRSFQG